MALSDNERGARRGDADGPKVPGGRCEENLAAKRREWQESTSKRYYKIDHIILRQKIVIWFDQFFSSIIKIEYM